jgi:hypothetical protein
MIDISNIKLKSKRIIDVTNNENYKIEDIELFIDALKIKDTIQCTLYDVTILYKNDELIKYKIFKLIHHYIENSLLSIAIAAEQILTTIFNNITDFKITFLDGKYINCLKLLLVNRIPYFQLINNENLIDSNEILLNTDSTITKTLIHIVYFGHIETITIENFLDICKLMDMWLIDNIFNLMADFALKDNNIYNIIKGLFLKNNNNDILILYTIFKRFEDGIFRRQYNLYGTNSYNNKMKLINVCSKISGAFNGLGGDIFIFKQWNRIFTPQQILHSIQQFKRYDMLDISGINSKDVVSFLTRICKNDEFITIMCNNICSYNMYFSPGKNKSYVRVGNGKSSSIIIDSYYPIFSYIELTNNFLFWIKQSKKNSIIIDASNCNLKCFSVGEKILFGECINTLNLTIYYTIVKIIATHEGNETEVDQVQYVHPKKGVTLYEVFFDRDLCSTDLVIWTLKEKTYDIQI